ncbi:MAG: amidohydrolase [Deltaproteobacteria bacterium]|nr:MAG: amidohydrolase [Deltaproteobacteria bacterium]
MRIDMHTHILPEHIPPFDEQFDTPGWIRLDHHRPGFARMMKGDTFFREIEANCWDPEVRIRECDTLGIDIQVLSTVPVMFGWWAPAKDALEVARFLNDDLAQTVRAFPHRFVALGSVPLQDPALAADEMRRCIRDLGMPGVQIGSHVNDWNLDEDELTPFWEAAHDLEAAVMVHPWDMMAMEKMPRHWLPWLVGMPAETSLAMCSLLMGGIVEKYPRIRFCFNHGGGAFPGTLARIRHGFDVRPDLCQTRTTTPPDELLDRIWVDSVVHDERSLHFLLDVFPHDRVVLGSDYPFPLGELQPGTLLREADLDPTVRDAIGFRNALDWLRLDPERFQTP